MKQKVYKGSHLLSCCKPCALGFIARMRCRGTAFCDAKKKTQKKKRKKKNAKKKTKTQPNLNIRCFLRKARVKKKNKTKPNLYLGRFLRKARVINRVWSLREKKMRSRLDYRPLFGDRNPRSSPNPLSSRRGTKKTGPERAA